MVRTAVELPNQTYPTAEQVELGSEILAAPDMYAEGFALAVAGIPYIALDSTDDYINYGVNSVFDAVAGSYEYVTDGGAVMPYPVAAVRGKNFKGAAAIPWYLEGGVSAANCIAAYQPKGAADIATSYVNLANPGTYDALAMTGAPTFDTATGWTFNGSNQSVTTRVIPNTGWSMIVRYSNRPVAGNKPVCGGGGTTGGANSRLGIYAPIGGTSVRYDYGNTQTTGAVLPSAGVIGITAAYGYIDGSPDVATGGAFTAGGGYEIYAGANNDGRHHPTDGAFPFWAGNVLALSIYNTTLSDAQVLAISTAMAAL